MRDYISPVSLVAQRIPRIVLEDTYGIILPMPAEHEDQARKPTASELLSTYAAMRGFRTSHGAPDESRAARIVLKNYVAGKLLYCFPPPDRDEATFNGWDKIPARAPKGMCASIASAGRRACLLRQPNAFVACCLCSTQSCNAKEFGNHGSTSGASTRGG
jgi:hypothetical protein